MRSILFSIFLLTNTVFVFSQVKEVKGVTSRFACYENCEHHKYTPIYGFEYENFNSFPVTIEAEKWHNQIKSTHSKDFLSETKTFILQPREKYIWKVGMAEFGYGNTKSDFYTKFKAFKNEE